jgi:hypothetical protein
MTMELRHNSSKTEWYAFMLQNNLGTRGLPSGTVSNVLGGYGNVTQFEYYAANSEFVSLRLFLENTAMADWVNCPYMTYDYNDHYGEIGVPILAIELDSSPTLREPSVSSVEPRILTSQGLC